MSRRWRQANRERFTVMVREWRRAHPASVRMSKYKRRTLEADGGTFSQSDIINLMVAQDGKCAGPHCQCDISRDFTIDHKLPLTRGGTSHPHNLQLLCLACNSSKDTRTNEEWAEFLAERARAEESLQIQAAADPLQLELAL